MTTSNDSVRADGRGDVIAPTASSLRKRALDGAALAASAAPGEPDPVQPVAAHPLVTFPQFDGPDGHGMKHDPSVA